MSIVTTPRYPRFPFPRVKNRAKLCQEATAYEPQIKMGEIITKTTVTGDQLNQT